MKKELNFQRDFFAALISTCHVCDNTIYDSIMNIANGSEHECSNCLQFYRDFQSYWQKLTNSSEEVKTIARNNNARKLLRKIFYSYSYKGIHTPLILPEAIKIEVTKRCNLNCRHCLANSGSANFRELTLSEIENLLTEAHDLGVTSVALVGGEPFLRRDLSAIIDVISELGMSYSISSNGTLINTNIVNRIKRKNLLKVSVSLDGTEEYHNQLRVNNRAYERTIRGIKILTENNIKVAVAMVITKENCEMIEHVIKASYKAGASYFVINDLIPTGRGIQMKDVCLSYSEYLDVTERMKHYSDLYKDKIEILWKGMRPDGPGDDELGLFIRSKCGAALTELTIDNEGYVLPCPFLPKTDENILHKKLKDIWYGSDELIKYQTRNDLNGGCGNCNRKLSCSGCRARALAHTGDLYGSDIRCPRCQ